jgi:hypothetical protein
VAHAQPEHEPNRERLAECLPTGGHRHRVAPVDLRDARAHRDARRRVEEQRGVDERVTAHRVGHPDRAVPELVELGGELAGTIDRLQVENERPDADPAEVHQLTHRWTRNENTF